MPTYTADVTSSAAPEEAFAYLAQFDNAAHWDPGVVAARAETAGPPALGSVYALTVRLGKGTEVLRYEITEFSPHERLVLCASGSKFDSRDEITVRADGDGSRVTYSAQLELKGITRLGAPLAARALRTAGDAAIAGLARALSGLGS